MGARSERDRTITVQVHPDVKAQLVRQADAAGLSLSAYCAAVLFATLPPGDYSARTRGPVPEGPSEASRRRPSSRAGEARG